jgi:putrescine transport system permease protein
VRLGISPQINALATIIIALVSFAVLAAGLLMRQTGKSRG